MPRRSISRINQNARRPDRWRDRLACAAAGVFIAAVAFDVLPEVSGKIGWTAGLTWAAVGLAVWAVLKLVADHYSRSGLAVVSALAFWFHSLLEGAVTALSFSAGLAVGLVVAGGMLLHLAPEFFAITSYLRGEGVSMRRSVWVDLVGIGILFVSFGLIILWLRGLSGGPLADLMAVSGGAFAYIGVSGILKRPKTAANTASLAVGVLAVAVWTRFFRV